MKLILTGLHAGKTIVLNHHQFVNGALTLFGQPHEIQGAVKYLGVCYAAFPEGSEQLKAAQAAQEKSSGVQRNTDPAAKSGNSNGLQGDRVQPTGEIPVPTANDSGANDSGQSSAGGAGMVPGGSGQTDAGLLPEQVKRIKDVLTDLDPAVDDFWTEAGQPSVEVIAKTLNDPAITRKMLEAVMPDFNREIAKANREL